MEKHVFSLDVALFVSVIRHQHIWPSLVPLDDVIIGPGDDETTVVTDNLAKTNRMISASQNRSKSCHKNGVEW